MAENNQELMKFVAWVKQTKMPNASPEEVVSQIQAMSQDQEQGVPMLQSWMEEFQAAEEGGETGMFKKGGKLNQLVEKRKIAKAQNGGKTSVKDKAPETKKTRVVNETIYDDTGSIPIKDITKTFVINGPKGQRDSTMTRFTDASLKYLTSEDLSKDRGTYYTPTGAQKVWNNYN